MNSLMQGENATTPLPHLLARGAAPVRFLIRADELRRVERDQGANYIDTFIVKVGSTYHTAAAAAATGHP
ncbi:hypothetical protein [Streptomyces sp. NPDC057740]|uniref:hypothetical protein n=1 Tax=Streptomyces sp. NPDC057740 TaxID=3346234 RepID=UPI0036BF21C7